MLFVIVIGENYLDETEKNFWNKYVEDLGLVADLFLAFAAASHPDYCNDDFNCMGFPHIGCNNTLWNDVSTQMLLKKLFEAWIAMD